MYISHSVLHVCVTGISFIIQPDVPLSWCQTLCDRPSVWYQAPNLYINQILLPYHPGAAPAKTLPSTGRIWSTVVSQLIYFLSFAATVAHLLPFIVLTLSFQLLFHIPVFCTRLRRSQRPGGPQFCSCSLYLGSDLGPSWRVTLHQVRPFCCVDFLRRV